MGYFTLLFFSFWLQYLGHILYFRHNSIWMISFEVVSIPMWLVLITCYIACIFSISFLSVPTHLYYHMVAVLSYTQFMFF